MPAITIEIREDQRERLRSRAKREHRSEEEICAEILAAHLDPAAPGDTELAPEGRNPLLDLIGMVPAGQGRSDSSILHDFRPEDPV